MKTEVELSVEVLAVVVFASVEPQSPPTKGEKKLITFCKVLHINNKCFLLYAFHLLKE